MASSNVTHKGQKGREGSQKTLLFFIKSIKLVNVVIFPATKDKSVAHKPS